MRHYCVFKNFEYLCSSIFEKDKIGVTSMYLTAEKKQEFFKTYGDSEKDTGSSEGQIALFSFRINHLTEHLKLNKKDFSTQRALMRLVGKRRRLLEYLKKKDPKRYEEVAKALKLGK